MPFIFAHYILVGRTHGGQQSISTLGGAIFTQIGGYEIVESVFSNCDASNYGGAIYHQVRFCAALRAFLAHQNGIVHAVGVVD